MGTIKRRSFIGTTTVAATSAVIALATSKSETKAQEFHSYQGKNLAGWDVVVGDGIYAAPGEEPVSQADIETIHTDNASELRANIRKRSIMAHNITVKTINSNDAFQYTHTCRYTFRLPYLPVKDNTELNAQTIEGGIFIWDGSGSRIDYGLGFHWILNPWLNNFGEIGSWSDINGGQWVGVGNITPDTNWHELEIVVDFQKQTTSLKIDNKTYPSCFTGTQKPETWGRETSARIQVEIISLYPGNSGIRALHKAEVKDWFWIWEATNTCKVFIPVAKR